MKQILLALILSFTQIAHAGPAGTADQVMRVPSTGGIGKYGSIDLSKSATVGSSILGVANGGTGKSSWTAPTIQKFTSGSGTYITPAGVKYIRVRMVGGGGGGAGGGSSATAGQGGAGGDTTFGSSLLIANAGSGGTRGANGSGGVGGNYTINSPAIGSGWVGSDGMGSGGTGDGTTYTYQPAGGASCFGGAGAATGGANSPGGAGSTNTGSGGGGGGGGTATTHGGSGGSGGCIDAIIANPEASYPYSVGTGGSAGGAGTGGFAGGAGAAGYIEVTEFYQ